MAIRVIEPFLNFAGPVSGSNISEASLLTNGIPHILVTGTAVNAALPWSLTKVGEWLRLAVNGNSAQYDHRCGLARALDTLITFTATTVLYGGVRVRVPRVVNNKPNAFLSIYDKNNLSSYQNMFLLSDIPNMAWDVEYYLEWCIDIPAGKIRRRLDGVDLVDLNLSAQMNTMLVAAQRGRLCYGGPSQGVWSSSAKMMLDVKDGYILEKTPDGIASYWLGPQLVRPLKVAEFTAPYTNNAAEGTSNLDSLNTPITTPDSRLTPVVTSDHDVSPASVKFDVSNIAGKINAVSLQFSGIKPAGKVATVETQFSAGGNDDAKRTVGLTGVMSNFDIYLNTQAPNGVRWTKALLAAATLKLQPAS